MDGIDLLIIIGCLILIFFAWHFGHKYSAWSEWDIQRRHRRMIDRLDYHDQIAEDKYRKQLRLLLPIFVLTQKYKQLIAVTDQASESMKEFARKLVVIQGGKDDLSIQSGEHHSDSQHPGAA